MTTEDLREKILHDMCTLAEMYIDDDDIDAALRWLNAAADLGSEQANWELGKIYYYGNGVPEDEVKAATYFEKSGDFLCDGLDEYGVLEVSTDFGGMYRYGKGVEKNIYKAIFWYDVQMNHYTKGSSDSMFALGEIYRDGEGGIQPDGEKAIHYFMDLVEEGNDYWSDRARFALGCIYLYGQAVERDIYKAAWWFAKTDEIYHYDNGEVFDLAECYRTGDGIERDINVAIAWYEKIIEDDFACLDKALFALAEIYFHGDGVEKDLRMVKYLLDKTIKGLPIKIET